VRLFRLDRVEEVAVLDEPAAPPVGAEPADVSRGAYRPRPGDPAATLLLEPGALWVSEYYPVDDVAELADGRARVRMRYADEAWLVRLVLGLGGEARVEDPPELAAAVAGRARAALRALPDPRPGALPDPHPGGIAADAAEVVEWDGGRS
jgi:proteasome accessory factor C